MERDQAIRAITKCLTEAMPEKEKGVAKVKPGDPLDEVRREQDQYAREHDRALQLIDRIEAALRLISPRRRFTISHEAL